MKPRDLVLALAVTVCWGLNFVVIDVGLREFPPFLLAALRYLFTALPAVFFVKRPDVQLRWLVAVGLCIGVGQFGLLFLSLHLGMPAGLASLVVQGQAIFTLLFGAVLLRERLGPRLLLGTLLAALGIAVIGAGSKATVPLVALLLSVGSGACWGAGNVAMRMARPPAGLGLLVWSSLVAPLPLFALSLVFDGPAAITHAVTTPRLEPILALAFIVVLANLFGYGVWTSLLRRYPVAMVAPISLLVPVTGLITAWLALGERPNLIELGGALVVVAGLLLLYVRLGGRRPNVASGPS
ncbi:MAG: EamA family transporter [Candidatus Dormiibacterota bacterium]